MPLTDLAIRSATPKDKAYKLYDGGGLYVGIQPSGGKWWRYEYRFMGKRKLLALAVINDGREVLSMVKPTSRALFCSISDCRAKTVMKFAAICAQTLPWLESSHCPDRRGA